MTSEEAGSSSLSAVSSSGERSDLDPAKDSFRATKRPWDRLRHWRFTPLLVLLLLMTASLGTRAAFIGIPDGPVFDETYYVGAARTILELPERPGWSYAGAQAGLDPNTEHPPLAKLIIAAGMLAFGDNPVGWRVASLLFGSLAILAMYALVRSAGGRAWLALAAASLMALDNLYFVHGRIATLDIFVAVFMLTGVTVYLRGRPLTAGLIIGIGACTKLVGMYALLVIALIEGISAILRPSSLPPVVGQGGSGELPTVAGTARLASFSRCMAGALTSYLVVLLVLDSRFSTFANPFAHSSYMYGYATKLKLSLPTPGMNYAPESSAWEWLVNRTPITYYEQVSLVGGSKEVTHFEGRMTPFILYFAIPGLILMVHAAWRQRDRVSVVSLAWFLGTFTPFVVLSFGNRYNYIYYMLIVLPAIYVAVARLFISGYLPRWAAAVYAAMLSYGFWIFYPFRAQL